MFVAKVLVLLLVSGICSASPFRRVVNSKEVEKSESRPWVAWIHKGKERLHCGATLVSDMWVVTAASCINRQSITGVVVGDHDLTIKEGSEQFMNISNIIKHPNYNEITLENDLALIQLTDAVVLDDNVVKPIPFLASNTNIIDGIELDDIYAKHCRIAGWGQPTLCAMGAEFANPLQELVVDRVNDTHCDEVMNNRPSTVLCFHPFRRPELSSTCIGDVGGPYICKIRKEWHLLGVISAWETDEVCTPGFKGATKLPPYGDWILHHIGPLPTTTSGMIIDPPLESTTAPTTQVQPTGSPVTTPPIVATPTVSEPTTGAPTEVPTTTGGITTQAPAVSPTTTGAITTPAPTGAPTTTGAITTPAPTVAPTNTGAITTQAPTGVPTTTGAITTQAPTGAPTTTGAITTQAPTGAPTTTGAITTQAPTGAPATIGAITTPATTGAPTTTGAITTQAPTGAPTTTGAITTPEPTGAPTTTGAITTQAPTNAPTTTGAITTQAPTNAPTTTGAITTQAPTNAPTTVADVTTGAPTKAPGNTGGTTSAGSTTQTTTETPGTTADVITGSPIIDMSVI